MSIPKVLLWHHHGQYSKRGASNRGLLERALSNQLSRRFSKKDSCPSRSKPPPKCPLPDPSKCEPPAQTSLGRETGQEELTPCHPDCRPGEPNLTRRGCLPWERGSEICPTKSKPRKLETQCCEHMCEPYIGQGIIDKLHMSTCEYRIFKKCFERTKNAKLCKDLGPSLSYSKKEYPMVHALCKKYIPGCPKTSHRFVIDKKDQECNN